MNRRLLVAVAGMHLGLVFTSAFQWNVLPENTFATFATRFYMTLSGADGYYGFFAPGVGPQIRIRMRIADAAGRETVVSLRNGETAEADLRMAGIGRLLPNLQPQQNRELLQSLAASAFNRHPDAQRVSCIVEMYGVSRENGQVDFPTMEEYCDGVRPKWITIDGITFTRPTGNATAVTHRDDLRI